MDTEFCEMLLLYQLKLFCDFNPYSVNVEITWMANAEPDCISKWIQLIHYMYHILHIPGVRLLVFLCLCLLVELSSKRLKLKKKKDYTKFGNDLAQWILWEKIQIEGMNWYNYLGKQFGIIY